ncbi:MAG: DNA gyrase inhibitor YacG [Planctomycetota bacterium]
MSDSPRQPAPDFGPPACPICGTAGSTNPAHQPFCSARCKKVDLGRWFDGRYVISRPVEQRDLDEGTD